MAEIFKGIPKIISEAIDMRDPSIVKAHGGDLDLPTISGLQRLVANIECVTNSSGLPTENAAPDEANIIETRRDVSSRNDRPPTK